MKPRSDGSPRSAAEREAAWKVIATNRKARHEYEFHDKADLARFLEPWFANVQVWETVFPTRTNLYFFASDGDLPMDRPIAMTVRKP